MINKEASPEDIQRFWQYVTVGPGWMDLIINLDTNILNIDPDYVVNWVSTYNGILRFSYYTKTPQLSKIKRIRNLVEQAEKDSLKLCEICGEEGLRRNTNKTFTIFCKACFENYKQNKEECPSGLW